MLNNITILIGFMMILNAGFSIIQYRRFLQLQSDSLSVELSGPATDGAQKESDSITLTLDLKIEIAVGLLLGMLGTINKYTANLDSIVH